MRKPLVVVTGVAADAMDEAMLSLSWDAPRAVTVRHRIDPWTQVLTRTVSDVDGIVERAETELAHACVTCAVREDVLPTLERLSADDRYESLIACLPTGAAADQVSAVLAGRSRLSSRLRLATVVAALTAQQVVPDLLGDDLLCERDVHSGPDDRRGHGEVACALVEAADAVVLTGDEAGQEELDLVRALARPETTIHRGIEELGASSVDARRDHRRAAAWCATAGTPPLPPLGPSLAWRLDLSAERAFHPQRLLDQVSRLGGGRHRSRGCFWVPTRPWLLGEWAGAGGQLSIGSGGEWGTQPPRTRLIMTGIGRPPADLVAAFDDLLLTPQEDRRAGGWCSTEDGLEPWLGLIGRVA
jgi:G3E family GTPase